MIINNKQGTIIFDGDDLRGANLFGANLFGANLTRANLTRANLTEADLTEANLTGANLTGANLFGADLFGAKLDSKDLQQRTILPEGDLIGWKKLADGTIAKLRIPANAKRVGGLTGRKCRAEFAIVLEGAGIAMHDSSFRYEPGQTVKPREPFNGDPREVCASGIHFYITRIEAEQH